MDKRTEHDSGHGGEVQARQSEDGTFELVVSDAASHGTTPGAQTSRSPEPEVRPQPRQSVAALIGSSRARVGLILVVVALVGGGLAFALSSSDEQEAPVADGAEAGGGADGFRPYKGAGSASAAPADDDTEERLKAAEGSGARQQADDSSRDNRREAQAIAQPDRAEQANVDQQSTDEDDRELTEAELLEEARAVERAEAEAAKKAQENAEPDTDEVEDEELEVDEEEEVADEQNDSGETLDDTDQAEKLRQRKRMRAPQLNRVQRRKVNRLRKMGAGAGKPALRGLRGMKRRQNKRLGTSEEQNPGYDDDNWEDDDEYYDEQDEEGRVPGFGRD